jgi:hypothetical protein
VVAFSHASVQLASSARSESVAGGGSGGVSLHDIGSSKHQIIAATIFFMSFSKKQINGRSYIKNAHQRGKKDSPEMQGKNICSCGCHPSDTPQQLAALFHFLHQEAECRRWQPVSKAGKNFPHLC